MTNRPEISQDAAYALLSAIKALMKDMTFISGSTYGLDSYRQACNAIAEAEVGNRERPTQTKDKIMREDQLSAKKVL